MSFLINLLLALFVLDSIILILIVLMQRPKSEGLGAAFGGGMTDNLFGAQTTNVLAKFTRWLGGIFFFLALVLSILYAKQSARKSTIQAEVLKNAKPVESPAPAASAAPVLPTGVPLALPAASPAMTPTGAVNNTAAPAASASPAPASPVSAPAAAPSQAGASTAPAAAPQGSASATH